MTTIVAPPGYNWREITAYIMKTYNIEISGGLGISAGMVRSVKSIVYITKMNGLGNLSFSHVSQVLRVGLMGCNSSKANVDKVLEALADALKHCHKSRV